MSPRPAGATRRLRLEQLESRLALATLYVSTSGNDGASGSEATPWRTLQHAANQVQAGDTVIVRAGNYVGFHLTEDGTAANRITFRGETGANITQRNATTPDGINLEGADYVTIEGFTVNNMPRTGIRSVLNHHVIIRDNRCDSNFKWGILTGFSDDILIEGNTTSRSQDEHGIYFSNSADRAVIRNNISWGNRANGIHMNGDVSLGGDGILSNCLVEGNIIFGNGVGGGSGINCDGVQNSTIRNNLIYDTHASGISLYRIDGGGGSSGNLVVNNTVIVAADGRWAMNIQGGSTGNTLRNNIFLNNHSFRGSIDISADSLTGFTSDYNVLMNRMTTNGGTTVQTLAQWQASGRDAHSLVATPAQLFVNAAAFDFHLSATSPAAEAGTSSFAPSIDLEGNARPMGAAVDIGAYERDGAPAVNDPPTDLSLSNSSVNENAANGKLVGLLSAVDPDAGDSHTYTLVNNAGGRFGISGNQLVVVNGSLLDFEAGTSHSITVRVTDSGGETYDESFTISVQNVNEVVSFDVQRGAAQRSYIRYLDVVFESAEGLAQLIAEGRLWMTRYSLTGTGGSYVNLAGKAVAIGNRIQIDFGVQGIGGNRNTSAGDGYYRLRVDADDDGTFETWKHFYRLLGDTNRDRWVNTTDVNAVNAARGQTGVRNTDLNGDLVVNTTDVNIVNRQRGRSIANWLALDD
jgi:hypothetical protein